MQIDRRESPGPLEHFDRGRVARIDLDGPDAVVVDDRIDAEQADQIEFFGQHVPIVANCSTSSRTEPADRPSRNIEIRCAPVQGVADQLARDSQQDRRCRRRPHRPPNRHVPSMNCWK